MQRELGVEINLYILISVKRVVGATSIYEEEGEVLENVRAATAPMI